MKVLITGGAGFLGRRLATRLLARGELAGPGGRPEPIDELLLLDVAQAAGFDDARVTTRVGDIADRTVLERAIDTRTGAIFHLAAIVSGQAEADFELGMRINLDASRTLLEVCRALGHRPRVVFTSSVAVYGGALPQIVQDDTALNPQSSYGTQKAIAELLLCDYTRRGFVDGRVLRLPTISVRPGRPNAAASSFASGIIREPLNGVESVCPVPLDTRLWLLSPRRAIDALVAGCELDGEQLGSRRIVNLPGISVSVGEMIDALREVAGDAPVARIRHAMDPRVAAIVGSWPGRWDVSRAASLGFVGDAGFADVIRAYLEDERG
ncbi:D-erythronate dehydrogenase [Burkholderia glumae]|uniref:SDR family oxidoreductase n=1 Tax=Burkholderia glumae TaxID=337 RepID=A0AAP9XXP2_BURGL|nr:D-erythronate dehydrogenase [Burkholderia glumae]ACR30933.1 NAD-dependent epimerase/dehydratase [Burkholderia glumae BGR1]AJY63801.1 3-beta hydroxysteroid dehydrogenase/isomerase family protein [Burkholderia glumae LMG 2196 = ATCC 33617]KHJ61863.1 NAD-dependent epimerase [Burkholderia glumae]MCM2483759.1 SDR family oxidoreductase [Burkholderia glumae]MCM2509453.1 SDR family oxidoreductase [Burkholderia glumae]